MAQHMISNESNTASPVVASMAPIVSDELRELLDIIVHALILIFAVLGVVTNVVNIRVFIYQGLRSDSNTIGLFSLAVTDFAGCIFEVPAPFCVILPYVGMRPVYYSCVAWTSLVGHTSHMLMSRITCWITVYIAVERSLCVLMPFKVKAFFRPGVTTTFMLLIYVLIFCPYILYFINTWTISVFHSRLNMTVTILKQSSQGKLLSYYISLIFNTILSSAAIIIVAIATGLMIYKLLMSRKWRKSVSRGNENSSQAKDSSQSKRDIEVLKTVTMITGLFLVCTLMSQIPGLALALVPGTSSAGYNKNLHYVAYGYKVLSDLINSSLNFFFYIRCSSRYKAAFNDTFGKKDRKKETEKKINS